ncbi:DUF6792 domain-containing protein [Lacticaseibacillus songhuajiangensis]|uniref:DUF6792 domain-containing protein n=1 Tax=Lacticaseibacillus songhuajiangensis TaxID=1296539 RepID=UPI000F76E054|nr:DUF6792 domain-containing protein [Lacticaseibacillus songhuajiangensis]
MSDRSKGRVQELLAQTRSLWAICERFDEVNFELNALIPLAQQPAEHTRVQADKRRIGIFLQLLCRRRAALLNHVRLTISRHHVLTDSAVKTRCLQSCDELIASHVSGLSVDVDAPLAAMSKEFAGILHNSLPAKMRELVMVLELNITASPLYRPRLAHRGSAAEVFANRELLCILMEFDAYPHDFPGVTPAAFVRFLSYHYAHVLLDDVRIMDVRTSLPQAAPSGIAGNAYLLETGGQTQVIINFRGAERSGQNGEWQETARDWDYMLRSVLLGKQNQNDQLRYALQFVELVQAAAPSAPIYALGHSLGGQLVQAVQLLRHPFVGGFTVNSVPLQVRQLELAAPKRFTAGQWRVLAKLADHKNRGALDLEDVMQQWGEPASQIVDRSFASDFTELFNFAPGTVVFARRERYTLRDWHYPFNGHLGNFLSGRELQLLMLIVDKALQRLERANSAGQLLSQLTSYLSGLLISLLRSSNQQEVARFINHVFAYLYATGLFAQPPRPIQIETNSKKKASWRSILFNLHRQREFLSSLNSPLMDTMINMHIVNGAKFIITDEALGWPVTRVSAAAKLQLPLPMHLLAAGD